MGAEHFPAVRFQPAVEQHRYGHKRYRESHPPRTGEERTDDRDGENDDVRAPCSVPVAAQRDVQVIPQPARQRHVPAAPELLGILRLVRGIEVLGQIETHEHGDTGGDVRVAGEIGIDLQGIAEQGGQVLEAGVQERIAEYPVAQVHGQIIGQDQLFDEAVQDPEHRDAEPAPAQVVGLVQLREKLRGTDDRTRHQLREKSQEETELQEIA